MEHAQTILTSDDIEELKAVTGEEYTKNALATAVEFTIKNYKKPSKKGDRTE